MRFHIGLSFRWSSIKKVLFPILIGLLAYLGFNGIFDNFNPLGFIQVNALDNYDTTFYLSYQNYDFVFNRNIDSNITYKTFFDSVIGLDSEYNDLIILLNPYRNSSLYTKLDNFTFLVVPKSSTTRSIDVYQRTGNAVYGNIRDINRIPYSFVIDSTITDIYSSSTYLSFLSCYVNNDSCGNLTSTFQEFIFALCSINGSNTSSPYCDIPYISAGQSYNSSYGFIYYSSSDLILSNIRYPNSSNYFYKNLNFLGTNYGIGDKYLTYLDYMNLLYPVPDEPDIPSDEEVNHKSLFDKIYWFDDKNSTNGILTSIYEVLFLYCLTMICFRILTFLKNKRW